MDLVRNNNFQILNSRLSLNNNNNRQENLRYEEEDSFSILKSLNESLNKDLSQSVLELVKCFICYNQAIDPKSCPKCNNFACSKCLEMYFGNQRAKKCPICKQKIELKELKKNDIIYRVEQILNKCESGKNKINELQNLIEEKKIVWEDQTKNINNILEKIFRYQESLQEYKREYELFFMNCQKVVEKTFEDYSKKTEELVNSLLCFNKLANESIVMYDNISKKNQNNYYNEKNIKSLVNELLNLERKHFNDKNNEETYKFLNTPIKIMPFINQYHIREMRINKNDIMKFQKINTTGFNYKIGNYKLKYSFDNEYNTKCEFSFTLKNKMNACFFVTQNKITQNGEQTVYPMKLINNENNIFNYECNISFDELMTDQNCCRIKTDIIVFDIQ